MKRIFVLTVMTALTFWANVEQSVAVENEAAKKCAGKSVDAQRLLCYDLLFRTTQTEVTPKNGTGVWRIQNEVSKLDDTKNVFLSTKNTNNVTDRFGRAKTITMHIQCRENTTLFYVHFDTFMSDHRNGTVTYRLDKAKARTVKMRESNNNQALGLWNGGSSIPMLRKMLGKKYMLIQATPHSDSAITAEFDIAGIDTAIAPLAEACGWKP